MTMNDIRQGLWVMLLSGACLVTGYGFALANTLNLTFNGSLTEWACEIVQATEPLEVVFPVYPAVSFDTTPKSPAEPVVLTLRNCPAGLAGKSIRMTFTAPGGTTTVGGKKMLNTTGDTGLVIALQQPGGTAIEPGTEFSPGTVEKTGTGTDNAVRLEAVLVKPDGVTLTEGLYSATTTFTVTYR